MHNAKFEMYYKKQALLGEDAREEDWFNFMESCRDPLPTTFRIAAGRETAEVLKTAIEKMYVPQLSAVVFEDEPVSPPVPLSWYPGGLGWQFNVPKKVLRKSPEFKKFHSFLVFETEVGNITRQEAVSMLPPLFLDVEPHHKVIDMCAAPGSKTSQLLEFLHSSPSPYASSVPEGLLVANDSDYKRTHLLIHQSARLPSPAMFVTNVDASIFPTLSLGIPSEPTLRRKKIKGLPAGAEPLLFDRILCDVPCSGDGTIRKNLGIWKYWNPMDGNGLHSLQLRILQRAMRMLHPDGRIVYSTCSLNPIENEAVIAAALTTIPGFELMDASTHLPTLQRRPGLHTWIPAVDRTLTFFETYEAYIESLPHDKRDAAKLDRSHWPPSQQVAVDLHLEKCMRIYPNLQDTGGFFVAVLHKKTPSKIVPQVIKEGKRSADDVPDTEVPEAKKARLEDNDGPQDVDMDQTVAFEDEAEAETAQIPPGDDDDVSESPPTTESIAPGNDNQAGMPTEKQKRRSGDSGFKEMPYTYISADDPIVEGCMRQVSLTDEFPRHNILVRNPSGEPARSLYLTNDLVRRVVQNNDFKRIRLMTAGTKIFTKQEGGFGRGKGEASTENQGASLFRLLAEGLPAVLPFIKDEAIADADIKALKVLVQEYYPLTSAFDEEFRNTVDAKSLGSHAVRFKAGSLQGGSLMHDLVLPIWKSNASIALMVDKKAKSALSLRVFGEDLTVAGREAAEKQKKKQVGQASGSATPIIHTEQNESPLVTAEPASYITVAAAAGI
ncbi:S-adenosyl-L-methionine-dependent methyltransferase [Amylostereum chailletii]|nr:S-adenosyl-L-methionine-dependent methyltransferase [Amylostereum chailletii]